MQSNGKRRAQNNSKFAADGDHIGLDVWPASLFLAEYLQQHPSVIAQRSVLELGSGVGVSGLTAASLGAREVIMTDYDETVQ